jgi:acyl carrier protein
MDMHDIESKVRSFIVESYLTEAEADTFANDDDLLKIIDSLQILRMVIAFEGTFGINIEDGDMTLENLASVRKVAALIARKRCDGRNAVPDVANQPGTRRAIGE